MTRDPSEIPSFFGCVGCVGLPGIKTKLHAAPMVGSNGGKMVQVLKMDRLGREDYVPLIGQKSDNHLGCNYKFTLDYNSITYAYSHSIHVW